MSASGTLLLVDDERSFVDMLRMPLEADGYTVLAAHSGADALAAYATHGPDLVLLDVAMPGMSGFDVCQQLVATYGDACAPVIFYTAFTSPAEITHGFDIGGADYLAKPCSLNEIRARVRSHVQNHLLQKQHRLLAEQLRRASSAKNRFLGMAAHDLRNPLVTIRGFSEMLIDGTVGSMPMAQAAVVTIIRDTAATMLKNVNTLLDATVLEAAEHALLRKPVSFGALADRAVANARIDAAPRGIQIAFSPVAGLPEIEADAEKLNDVLDQLLRLAINETPSGARVTADLHAAPDAATVALTVRTTTGHTARKDDADTVLAACRKIVEAHRGSLAMERSPDGIEFRLALPRTTS